MSVSNMSVSNTCGQDLLDSIKSECERQLKIMETKALKAQQEVENFSNHPPERWKHDLGILVATAQAAVLNAKEEAEAAKSRHDQQIKIQVEREQEAEKAREEQRQLEYERQRIKQQLDSYVDNEKFKKIKDTLKAKIDAKQSAHATLRDIQKKAKDGKTSDALESIKEAKKDQPNQVSAFNEIPTVAPQAALVSVVLMSGFRATVSVCLPCSAKFFMSTLLRQHGSKLTESLNNVVAFRVILKGKVVTTVPYKNTHKINVIFVKNDSNIQKTDVQKTDVSAGTTSGDTDAGECEKDLASLIAKACSEQMIILHRDKNQAEEELKQFAQEKRDEKIAELKIKQQDNATKLAAAETKFTEAKDLVDAENEKLSELAKKGADLMTRKDRFMRQLKKAKKQLELYANENASDILQQRQINSENVVQTLKDILELAQEGNVDKTLEFIKKETKDTEPEDADDKKYDYVYKNIPTVAPSASIVSVVLWTNRTHGILRRSVRVCIPCNAKTLVQALKSAAENDERLLDALKPAKSFRLVFKGQVVTGISQSDNIQKDGHIDVICLTDNNSKGDSDVANTGNQAN